MTDSLSKLTSIFESAKDLTFEVAASASSRLAETPIEARPKEIGNLLNSRLERDNLRGMKAVISIMSRGEDPIIYFADVVKNITSSNLKVKRLVLIYLTTYAEMQPDTALLSVNSIQKSLNDKVALERSIAIKSMSNIHIESLFPILNLCIKRTMTDQSPLVRAATATAIGNVIELDAGSKKDYIELLKKLLADSYVLVAQSAVKAYYRFFNDLSYHLKWKAIHPNFYRICSVMSQFDEWGQCCAIEILISYCKTFLPRPKLFLNDGEIENKSFPQDYEKVRGKNYSVLFDDDYALVLDTLNSLNSSLSEMVILCIAKAFNSLCPSMKLIEYDIIENLLRLVRRNDSPHISFYALQAISQFVDSDSSVFAAYYRSFYIYPSDSYNVALLKLKILCMLATEDNMKFIFEELKCYITSQEYSYIAKVAAMSFCLCYQISSEWNQKILNWTLSQISQSKVSVVKELISVTRHILQQKQNENNTNDENTIIKTTKQLYVLLRESHLNLDPEAKASIIWIIGEFTSNSKNVIGLNTLKLLTQGFSDEIEIVRNELLMLAAKVYIFELEKEDNALTNASASLSFNDNTKRLFEHILHLSKYDNSFDIRDRARLFDTLLNSSQGEHKLASLFLQVPKPIPQMKPNDLIEQNKDALDTKIHLASFFKTCEWSDSSKLPPSSIRDPLPVQYNNLGGNVTSMSQLSIKADPTPKIAKSETTFPNRVNDETTKKKYHLQSLDEFFDDEDDEDSDTSETDINSTGESIDAESEEFSSEVEDESSADSSEHSSEDEAEEQ